jgi:hypothetical protein
MYSMPATLLGVFGIAALQANPPHNAATTTGDVNITGYKIWIRVNPKPHKVSAAAAVLCAATPEERILATPNPHVDAPEHPTLLRWEKFVTVYVNEIAEHAMMHQKIPMFPQGSVIIKEKLAHPESTSPELLTVMCKREAGYHPAGGDWEYLVLDGSGRHIQAQGRLQTCQACHAQWKETDYVSRAYLANTVRRNLK